MLPYPRFILIGSDATCKLHRDNTYTYIKMELGGVKTTCPLLFIHTELRKILRRKKREMAKKPVHREKGRAVKPSQAVDGKKTKNLKIILPNGTILHIIDRPLLFFLFSYRTQTS